MHSFRDLRKPPLERLTLRIALLTTLALLLSLLAPSVRAQSFAQPKVIPTGNWPAAVLTADINSDGSPDLIYLDAGAKPTASTTHILLNDGHGNFAPGPAITTAGSSIAIDDFLGSGHPQLAYAFPAGASHPGDVFTCASLLQINLALLNGTSSVQSTDDFQICLTGANPPIIGNFTSAKLRAGKPADLLFTDSANNILYSVNLAAGISVAYYTTFSASLPDGPGPIAIADLNGDGNPDVVVNGLTGNAASIFLGSPLGLVASSSTRFLGLSGVRSLLAQDVNFDGIPDLIIEGAAGHVDVFPGNGDATFQTTSIGGTGPLDGTTGNGGHLIVAADLNHDGLLDALTATPAGISTLLGNGTAYLGLNGIYNAGPTGANGHPSYATADFNHDGVLDLAVDSPEGIAILFGNPDGTFQTSRAFAAGAPAMSSALGIFTASGHTDAVVSTGATQAQLLRGNGDGTFAYLGSPALPIPTSTQTGLAGLHSTVLVADTNHDGNLDLVLSADGASPLPASGSGLAIQLGDGAGGFAAPTSVSTLPVTSCAQHPATLFGASALADFNGDGFPDLVNRDFNGFRVFDTTSATPPPLFFANLQSSCFFFPHNLVLPGDFNNDGRPDLLLQSDGHLRLFLNTGAGQFNLPLGDLAVDGSLTTSGRAVAPDLSSVFGGPSYALGFAAAIGSMTVADLDGDGNNDLLVAYDNLGADHTAPDRNTAPNSIYIWYGSGGGKFLATAKHPVNPLILIPERNNYQLAIADLNGDKIPDLIMGDGYVITVAYGLGDGTFGREAHFLAGQGINTISAGDVNGDGIPDLVLANGGAVFTNPVANHDLMAANPDVNTGGVTVLVNQTPQAAPPALTSLSLLLCVDDPGSLFPCGNPLSATPLVSPITMYYGQVLDGVAIESATNLSGTITFYDGTRVFCTIPANLAGAGPTGNACPPAAGNFDAGNRSVDAVYSGDAIHTTSTSNSIVVKVLPDLTTSAIVSSLNPATVGQAVTFTATVTGNFATPVGAVTFFDLLTQIGTATLNSTGHAAFTTSTLAVGSHPISVAYQGTPNFNPIPAPAALLTQVIKPAAIVPSPTTTYLVAIGPTTILFNQPANSRYYTTVSDPSHPPTGTVTVQDNGVPVPYCTTIPYGSTCPYAAGGTNRLTVGTHSLVVLYNGDPFNAPSASAPLIFNVLPGTTAITLTSSLNPAPVGAPVTFTAALSGTPNLPTGSVNLLDGTTILATVPVDPSGNATFTTSTLAVGTHPISVAYQGNANFGSSISPVLNQVITPPATPPPGTFTLTVTPASPVTIPVGRTGLLLVTVTANGNFAQPVALTCATTTPETSCEFILPVVPVGGGSTTFELHTSAPHDCGDPNHPYFLGSCTPPPAAAPPSRLNPANPLFIPRAAALLLPGLIVLGLSFTRLRRRLGERLSGRGLTLLLLTLSLAGLTTLSGCGVCTDLGTQGGRYTFTITATAQGGPVTETQSQTIPLTVIIP